MNPIPSAFRKFSCLRFVLLLVLSIPANYGLAQQPQAAAREFSFLHLSDIHVSPFLEIPANLENERSYKAVRTIKDLGPVELSPYKVAAPKPSFMIATGDNAEFSFPGVTWQVFDKYFEGIDLLLYLAPGNHDNTWVADPETFRKRFGGQSYSFDREGCHFIILNSATLQEPVPSFGEEVILFLKKDLKKIDSSTPVFIGFHHPLNSGEFCSKYDRDRFLDAVRGYNVVLLLVGHGHSAVTFNFAGIDAVEGGSTFSGGARKTDGFNIVYVRGNDLYVAYKLAADAAAAKEMIHKSIPKTASYPKIEISSPSEGMEIKEATLELEVAVSDAPAEITSGVYELDDETTGALKLSGSNVSQKLDLSTISNGAHFIRFNFADEKGAKYQKSVAFFVDNPKAAKQGTAKWRFKMNGASKATPLVFQRKVFVGANDGTMYAVNQETGNLEWKFDAGAEILTSAAIWKNSILFGAANGKLFALDFDGKLKWAYKGDHAIFSSPVVDKGVVYFGNNAAELVALDADTGKLLWKNTGASYSVESTPLVWSNRVFYGAWDGYIHCVDRDTSQTLWKSAGTRNQETVNRYYAPADAGPVMAFGKLFVADRGYMAGEYDPVTGKFEKKISEDCSAIGISANGKFLYLRGTRTPILKLNADGEKLWESEVVAGRIPIPPVEVDGNVYFCTNSGRLCSLDARNGLLRWDYRVTPGLFVMSGVRVVDGVAYTTGLDGYLTAIVAPATSSR